MPVSLLVYKVSFIDLTDLINQSKSYFGITIRDVPESMIALS